MASARTMSSWSSERKLPAGRSKGAWRSTAATSPTDRPNEVRRRGSTTTRSMRSRSPNRLTVATPSMEIRAGMMSFSTIRVSASSLRVGLEAARRMMGLASASALMTVSCSTSSGSRRSIRLTASRTSLAAESRSTSGEKTTRIRKLSSSLDERTSLTPATRATAPSTRAVTSTSTVSGDAPGRSPRTVTMGRSMSGSSRTSTPERAASPASAISRFITRTSSGRRIASAGRSWPIMTGSPAPSRGLPGCGAAGGSRARGGPGRSSREVRQHHEACRGSATLTARPGRRR